MSLVDLAETRYGPVAMTVSGAKVAEYVAVTGDQPDRWLEHAPPSYAGALLFVMAPRFLWAPEVQPYTKVLIHSDQRFAWHGPLEVGAPVQVSAEVSRVRARGAMFFVTFDAAVVSDEPILTSTSTFVMSDQEAGNGAEDEGEPPVSESGPNDMASTVSRPDTGSSLPTLAKSASRADLVRYAGASGDFNPIHYDHETARHAGFGGVIVHGLLMGAWAAQLAAATSPRPDPLAELRLRFRNALRPGRAATVSGVVADRGVDSTTIDLHIATDDTELVTGRATVREG